MLVECGPQDPSDHEPEYCSDFFICYIGLLVKSNASKLKTQGLIPKYVCDTKVPTQFNHQCTGVVNYILNLKLRPLIPSH